MTAISPREVAQRLVGEREILISSHENPDGDAVGSVVALMLMAEQLGVAHRGYIPGETPTPSEYAFLPKRDQILRGAFPRVEGHTTIYILDCATSSRLDPEGLRCAGACLNIDHHPDNAGFGTHNLLVPTASSTTQILYDAFVAGGLTITSAIGTALYVGLLTDTGRFQYGNTTPSAHRMAADLQERGVDVNAVYRSVYETEPLPKVCLLGRAIAHMELRLQGELATSWIGARDFVECGADESHTEGLIDSIRAIEGVRVAALLRERPGNGGPEYKVSLRSTDGSVDVAAIAHLMEGGGHRQAAGLTMRGDLQTDLDWIETQVRKAL